MKIKFSHKYPKLHGQKTARLLEIIIRDREQLTDSFVNYDTVYVVQDAIGVCSDEVVDYYPLPKARYMILVFIGDNLIPFTTVRRFTNQKYLYYQNGIGDVFDIEYKP